MVLAEHLILLYLVLREFKLPVDEFGVLLAVERILFEPVFVVEPDHSQMHAVLVQFSEKFVGVFDRLISIEPLLKSMQGLCLVDGHLRKILILKSSR